MKRKKSLFTSNYHVNDTSYFKVQAVQRLPLLIHFYRNYYFFVFSLPTLHFFFKHSIFYLFNTKNEIFKTSLLTITKKQHQILNYYKFSKLVFVLVQNLILYSKIMFFLQKKI